jgi:PPOX class probable F420-dependent enzyme
VVPEQARRRFAAARVARLATIRPDGRPHVVPVTFVVTDQVIACAVDAKPKSSRRLQRLANIEAHPAVSLLVDVYDDDWSRLWWVRADGGARIERGGPEAEGALDRLAEKYPQYRAVRPAGPVVLVAVERWRGWSATTEEGRLTT